MTINNWDIAIKGGIILTMSEKMDILRNHLIGIKDGKIIHIGNEEAAYNAGCTIEAGDCLVMPGLVNTHTHLPMVIFRGMADDLPLQDWLNNFIFPAEKRFINKEAVYSGALLAMAEMILSGTTTFCDGYFYEDAVGAAAIKAGMRAVIAQGFLDFPTPDNPEPAKKSVVAERFINRWHNAHPLISPALFCHAPYTCSPQTLIEIKKIARKTGVLYFTHLLENKDESQDIEKRYGRAPVQHLDNLGVLDGKTIAVHCNWLADRDLDILAERGVAVSHNPESSMKLAAGVAPVPALLARRITCGLGTDGCASNNNLDMFGEMNTAAKLHKIAAMDPTVMNAETVVTLATRGGAKTLGMADCIGSIEIGKDADIILLDMNKPHLTPLYNCYSQIVYAAGGADVKTSIIGGKIVMKDRKLLTIDIDEAMAEVRRIAKDIFPA